MQGNCFLKPQSPQIVLPSPPKHLPVKVLSEIKIDNNYIVLNGNSILISSDSPYRIVTIKPLLINAANDKEWQQKIQSNTLLKFIK